MLSNTSCNKRLWVCVLWVKHVKKREVGLLLEQEKCLERLDRLWDGIIGRGFAGVFADALFPVPPAVTYKLLKYVSYCFIKMCVDSFV